MNGSLKFWNLVAMIIERDERKMSGKSLDNNNKCKETPIQDKKSMKKNVCPHKKTVALNEEGHAGIYCVACGEKLEDGC